MKQQSKSFLYEGDQSIRLDKFLATNIDSFSRSLISQWIKKGCVCLNGTVNLQPKTSLKNGDCVTIVFPENFRDEIVIKAQQASQLDIAFESESLLIINKEKNVVVHPGAGVHDGTLVNYLAHSHPETTKLPNWGLIHRLDKDTTGLLIIAKSEVAYHHLNKMMQKREITRLYQAFIYGNLKYSRTVETGMMRCHHNRLKRAVSHSENAKRAVTHIKILKHFEKFTHIQCQLETGRTHQIRVHCEHIGHPIIGDSLYKGRLNKNTDLLQRQALHAYKLVFTCPISKENIIVESSLPTDMQELI